MKSQNPASFTKKIENKHTDDKSYRKVKDHCHYGASCSNCILRYSIPKEILVVFHNRSNYDYHFTIKELSKEFDEGELNCLAENIENTKSFQLQ